MVHIIANVLQYVIVVFPDHTHLLFIIVNIIKVNIWIISSVDFIFTYVLPRLLITVCNSTVLNV